LNQWNIKRDNADHEARYFERGGHIQGKIMMT